MRFIVDEIILFILCVLIACNHGISTTLTVAMLMAVICMSLCYYYPGKKLVCLLTAVTVIVSIFIPTNAAFASTIIYILVYNEVYLGVGAMCILSPVIYHTNNVNTLAFMILSYILAVYLAITCRENTELKTENKCIRDESVEKTNLLNEKNKKIIEKQDQEIYVATLKERNRIAREIHDNVGHMLTRSILQLGALLTIHKNDEVGGQLEPVRQNLDEAMNNIRQSVHDLHDESVDIKQTLRDMVIPLEDKYRVNLEIDIQTDMNKDVKYAVIGIIKEAVSNIIKYSSRLNVDIVLREHPAMYQIMVEDYNDRNDSKKEEIIIDASSGMGLQNMLDRAEALNGNVSITKGDGYRVFVTLPRR